MQESEVRSFIMIATKDLQMEAYRKIDTLSDDDVRFIIRIIDELKTSSDVISKETKKKKIMSMAGKYDFDEKAIESLRLESMI